MYKMRPLIGRGAARGQFLAQRCSKHTAPRRAWAVAAPIAKMYVPSDSFGGRSPERKAADAMKTLFTFIAAKVILAQLEGSGRGDLSSYNAKAYDDLMGLLESMPMKAGGDEWLEKLMEKNELLGVRVMEVREAYCLEDFEWDECRKLATKEIKESNVKLLRRYADARIMKTTSAHPIWPAPNYGNEEGQVQGE